MKIQEPFKQAILEPTSSFNINEERWIRDASRKGEITGSYDFEKKANPTVKASWIEQGIWNNRWSSLYSARWKDEGLLELEPELEPASEPKSICLPLRNSGSRTAEILLLSHANLFPRHLASYAKRGVQITCKQCKKEHKLVLYVIKEF